MFITRFCQIQISTFLPLTFYQIRRTSTNSTLNNFRKNHCVVMMPKEKKIITKPCRQFHWKSIVCDI